jgi:hypothetical protein
MFDVALRLTVEAYVNISYVFEQPRRGLFVELDRHDSRRRRLTDVMMMVTADDGDC